MEFGRFLAPAGALAAGARALVVDLDREDRGSASGRQQVLSPLPGSLKVGISCHPSIALPARLEPPSKEAELKDTIERRGWRRWGGRAALAVGGLLMGGVLVGTLTASAADTNSTANQNSASGVANQNRADGGPGGQRPGGNVDESKSQRPDEQLLTAIQRAVLAKTVGAWPTTHLKSQATLRRGVGARVSVSAALRLAT
jgi:hypothetical protein